MSKINWVLSYHQDGKYFAIAVQSDSTTNQWSFLKDYEHGYCGKLLIAHICKSKKQAEETAYCWNKSYEANGTLLERFE